MIPRPPTQEEIDRFERRVKERKKVLEEAEKQRKIFKGKAGLGNKYRIAFANAGLRSEGKTGAPATHLVEKIMNYTPYKHFGKAAFGAPMNYGQGAAAGGHGGGRRKTKKVKKYNRRKSRSN